MKNIYRKINSLHYSLGELIEIVASCARDQRETIATLVDLLESGRVVLESCGRRKRVRVVA